MQNSSVKHYLLQVTENLPQAKPLCSSALLHVTFVVPRFKDSQMYSQQSVLLQHLPRDTRLPH